MAGAQDNVEQMRAFGLIDTNDIFFRLGKDNEEEDILEFFRAMLAQGYDAVMGFKDYAEVNKKQVHHKIVAYMMRKKGNKTELVWFSKRKDVDGYTYFTLL